MKETTSPSQDCFGLELRRFVKVADVEQRRFIWDVQYQRLIYQISTHLKNFERLKFSNEIN